MKEATPAILSRLERDLQTLVVTGLNTGKATDND
jgi:hypothetical protein